MSDVAKPDGSTRSTGPVGAAGTDAERAAADEAELAAHATTLADGVAAALPGWVVRSVVEVARAWRADASRALVGAAEAAGERAAADVVPRVRSLLATDVDQQRTGPLALLREAVAYPTAVLRDGGVPPVERDEFAARAFPADVYGLAPASFADLDPDLAGPGLVWGAAKAHVVLSRRRAEGLR